jgi:hypothetical protein
VTDSGTFVFFIVTLQDKYLYYRIAEKEIGAIYSSMSVVINDIYAETGTREGAEQHAHSTCRVFL